MTTKALFILTTLLTAFQIAPGQECKLTNLSRKYTYLAVVDRSKIENGTLPVSIEIFRKADGKPVQKLVLGSQLPDVFSKCDAVRSYVTGIHANGDADDNYWGDFLVADFNFDGREDFAIAEDSRNTGMTYAFFIQTNGGKFVRDPFLSGGFFPYKIDRKNKTLTTTTAATTAGYTETVLKYDPRAKKWRVLRSVHRKIG